MHPSPTWATPAPNFRTAASQRNRSLPGIEIAFAVMSAPSPSGAQSDHDEIAKQLANPVASLISVPLQNNFDYGGRTGDAFRYTLNVQPVIPISIDENWNLITRTILPISHAERVYPDHRSGLGDVTQSFFLSPARPTRSGITWGAGPIFLYPSGTEGLGQRQWGAGPTGVMLKQSGPWIYGLLANHIWSLGGTPDTTRDVDATFLQPFINYVTPGQTTYYLNTESRYDWSRRDWTVPINIGVNQLVSVSGQRMQFGGWLRYFTASPSGESDWGFRLNLVFVFPG
ncbi:transporter [Pseudoroseomonas globiformis]|uniref:Transporter n=1 Tax=Teichococcus globiformis TaxID=2307229 RepID=A0ABV7G396_9PROT